MRRCRRLRIRLHQSPQLFFFPLPNHDKMSGPAPIQQKSISESLHGSQNIHSQRIPENGQHNSFLYIQNSQQHKARYEEHHIPEIYHPKQSSYTEISFIKANGDNRKHQHVQQKIQQPHFHGSHQICYLDSGRHQCKGQSRITLLIPHREVYQNHLGYRQGHGKQ